MDFVDEQHVVALFEVGEQRREVARALQHGAGRLPQVDAHFPRDDVRERGLAQTRRPEQQHVVERFGTAAGGFNEDFELAAHLFLADVLVELRGRSARSNASSFGDTGVAAMMRSAASLSVSIMFALYRVGLAAEASRTARVRFGA
jgi:hypothetical protein